MSKSVSRVGQACLVQRVAVQLLDDPEYNVRSNKPTPVAAIKALQFGTVGSHRLQSTHSAGRFRASGMARLSGVDFHLA